MSTQTDLRTNVRKTLSKYNSEQLESKIAKGSLLGASLEVAKEIIAERKAKTGGVKEGYVKPGSAADPKKTSSTAKVTPAKKEEKKVEKKTDKKAAVTKPAKATKPAKEPKEKVEGSGSRPRTLVTDAQKADILKRHKAGESVYKIRVDLEMPWSAVNSVIKASGK